MSIEALKCDVCGSADEVRSSKVWWSAWGRSCADFNWAKHPGEKKLCDDCEQEEWRGCNTCGALIEEEHYGGGYLPEDYDGDYICPECAQKAGFEITVNIG